MKYAAISMSLRRTMTANRAETPRTLKGHVINVLSEDVAYSVTQYDLATNGNEAPMSQVVTKIWTRLDGTWLIAHLHESVGGR